MRGVPSGRVHNLINLATYGVLAAGVLVATRQGLLTVTPTQALHFSLGFFAGTFLLSPDLDLAEGQVDSKRRWGVLGFLWVPYGRAFSHRGLSHTWLLGPLTRLIYIGSLVGVLVGLLRFVWVQMPLPSLSSAADLHGALPPLLGYYVSQWLHLIADGIRPDHGVRHGLRKVRKAIKRR